MFVRLSRLVPATLILCLAACSKPAKNDQSASADNGSVAAKGTLIAPSSWKALPEDSVGAMLRNGGVAVRCWKRDGIYDCITAGKDQAVLMARRITPALPTTIEELSPNVVGGYSCELSRSSGKSYIDEAVYTSSGRIKSNRWEISDSVDGSALQDSDILRIMKDNGVNTGFQPLWCSGFGTKIADTSPAALLSSEIKYGDVVMEPSKTPSPLKSDGTFNGDCSITVDDVTYLNEKQSCPIETSDGTITINTGSGPIGYFAYIYPSNDGSAQISWNSKDKWNKAEEDLGSDFRQKNGCWVNSKARICYGH